MPTHAEEPQPCTGRRRALQNGVAALAHDEARSLHARDVRLQRGGEVAGRDGSHVHELPISILGEGLRGVHTAHTAHVERVPHLLARAVRPDLHTHGLLSAAYPHSGLGTEAHVLCLSLIHI